MDHQLTARNVNELLHRMERVAQAQREIELFYAELQENSGVVSDSVEFVVARKRFLNAFDTYEDYMSQRLPMGQRLILTNELEELRERLRVELQQLQTSQQLNDSSPDAKNLMSMFVVGKPSCTPTEFWVSIKLPTELPLDEVVCTHREVEGWGTVQYFGLVEAVEMGDPPINYLARVRILRIVPEVFVPPAPGRLVKRATPKEQETALHFDGMKCRIAAGLLPSGTTAYLNRDFLTGEKGGHVNIAGISGVATKTSYALFLLYSMFHSQPPRPIRGIVFNVKGDDLLHLDKPNARLTPAEREKYEQLGLPAGPFPQVAYYGVEGGLWTLREFAELELIRFLFPDGSQTDSQDYAADQFAAVLKAEAAKTPGPELVVFGKQIDSLEQLIDLICADLDESDSPWFERAVTNTRLAMVRKLRGVQPQVEGLLRLTAGPSFNYDSQLTVVDLHRLGDRGRAFVVGSVLKILFTGRDKLKDQHPTVYLVLDELNKYAPDQTKGPIKEMLLDVAERGRSLGILLLGAEQTASEVEPRVVGNAAIRVVGRLEAAECNRDSYDWLTTSLRQRAMLMQPGTMILSQPEVPAPLRVRFPFPAWATRSSEVVEDKHAQ